MTRLDPEQFVRSLPPRDLFGVHDAVGANRQTDGPSFRDAFEQAGARETVRRDPREESSRGPAREQESRSTAARDDRPQNESRDNRPAEPTSGQSRSDEPPSNEPAGQASDQQQTSGNDASSRDDNNKDRKSKAEERRGNKEEQSPKEQQAVVAQPPVELVVDVAAEQDVVIDKEAAAGETRNAADAPSANTKKGAPADGARTLPVELIDAQAEQPAEPANRGEDQAIEGEADDSAEKVSKPLVQERPAGAARKPRNAAAPKVGIPQESDRHQEGAKQPQVAIDEQHPDGGGSQTGDRRGRRRDGVQQQRDAVGQTASSRAGSSASASPAGEAVRLAVKASGEPALPADDGRDSGQRGGRANDGSRSTPAGSVSQGTAETARAPHGGEAPNGGGEKSFLRADPLAAARSQEPRGTEQAIRARMVQRVASAVRLAAQRGGHLRLRLSPPELGSLRLDVAIRQGALEAQIKTETAATRTLLIESLPALRERLAHLGIKVERFDVDVFDDTGGNASGTPDQRTAGEHSRGEDRGARHGGRPTLGATAQEEVVTKIESTGTVADDRLNVII